jgi:hypothetical protein
MQKVCSSFLAQKTCVLMVHPVSDLLQVAMGPSDFLLPSIGQF